MFFFRKKKKNNKKNDSKIKYLKAKDLREHFKITSKQLYKTLESLKWAIKHEEKGWKATPLAIKKGAKEGVYMGVFYIRWKPDILNDTELINAIKNLKEETTNIKPKKMTMKDKKQKGDEYEKYVAEFFRKKGCYVWEHGKEKGAKDKNIDLFVKKDKYIYFIQCKNWETWKIDHNKVKATRTDVREYLKEKPEFWQIIKNYKLKILYVTSKECLTRGAYKYIEENQDIVEYQVIQIEKD